MKNYYFDQNIYKIIDIIVDDKVIRLLNYKKFKQLI